MNTFDVVDIFVRDVRYAVRSLGRQPAFAVLAVATLALGIGANAAIFTVVNGVLLRPLPYAAPDRIVAITTDWRTTRVRGTVSGPDFHDWHDRAHSFDAMALHTGGETSVSVDGVADYARVELVTGEFFDVFGVAPQIGHLPAGRELYAGGPLTAVIGYGFWQRRFDGSPAVLGRTLSFQQRTFTIIGVMPPAFRFPDSADVWMPSFVVPETTSRSAHNYEVVGRLKDGVGVERAQGEMTSIAASLEQAYPRSNANKGAAVVPLREHLVGSTRATLYLLVGAVALVLLIACANVANLLLARATARTGELAVRAALGAGRGRLVRQMMTESLVLALGSGALGVLLARWGVAALMAIAPAGLPRTAEVGVDWRVLGFALLASLAASLVFGVLPAVHGSRVDLNASLRQGGRGGALGGGGATLRNVLVVAEIACAVALVVGASLLVRSFAALGRVDLGFNPDRLLVVESSVPVGDQGGGVATRFYASVLSQIAAIPGVTSAAGVRGLPGTSIHSNGGYWPEGSPGPEVTGVRAAQAVFTVVTPDYFRTMGVPVRQGRDFSARDGFDAPRVAIINDALARQSYAGVDPIGRRLRSGLDSLDYMTIVGVVGNVREYDPSRPPRPELYMPFEQHPAFATALTLVVRGAADPRAAANQVRAIVHAENAQVPARIGTMADTLSAAVSTPRFRTVLVGLFAGLAFVLAMAGVYGVMAYTVSRRRAEIGLRMALGAASGDVLRMVMSAGLRLAVVGIAIGCVLAYGVAQALRGMLFAVAPADPAVFIGAPIVLFLTAAGACLLPALRASRVDPMLALRTD
jgi:predicted permease